MAVCCFCSCYYWQFMCWCSNLITGGLSSKKKLLNVHWGFYNNWTLYIDTRLAFQSRKQMMSGTESERPRETHPHSGFPKKFIVSCYAIPRYNHMYSTIIYIFYKKNSPFRIIDCDFSETMLSHVILFYFGRSILSHN